MKVFVAGGTGVIGRPLIAELQDKGHEVVALTRSTEDVPRLKERNIEPAVADVFDAEAVKAVLSRVKPEIVIEQLTALPKSYTREAMTAAGPLNTRIRLDAKAKRELNFQPRPLEWIANASVAQAN